MILSEIPEELKNLSFAESKIIALANPLLHIKLDWFLSGYELWNTIEFIKNHQSTWVFFESLIIEDLEDLEKDDYYI